MSKFINRKEEVIQFEFTPYGRNLYSQGKFKPTFYSFYDDDILYDPDYSPTPQNSFESIRDPATEIQNQIIDRIKDTPRISVTRTYQNSLLNQTWTPAATTNGDPYNRPIEANDKFLRPIGTSDPFSEYAPSWDIRTLQGSVSFSGSITGSRTQEERISDGASVSVDKALVVPMLSCSIEIDYIKSQIPGSVDGQVTELPYWLLIEDNKLLIDVQEVNSIFKSNENFEIEVFRVEDPSQQQKQQKQPPRLKRLYFIDESQIRQEADGLLGDPESDVLNFGQGDNSIEDLYPDLDDTYVEYFLSIRVDKEIDDIDTVSVPSEGIYSGVPSTPEDPCD